MKQTKLDNHPRPVTGLIKTLKIELQKLGINVPNGLSKTVLHIFRKCETQSGRTGKSHFIFQLYSRKNYGAYDNDF